MGNPSSCGPCRLSATSAKSDGITEGLDGRGAPIEEERRRHGLSAKLAAIRRTFRSAAVTDRRIGLRCAVSTILKTSRGHVRTNMNVLKVLPKTR
jgi:hypothetical protein